MHLVIRPELWQRGWPPGGDLDPPTLQRPCQHQTPAFSGSLERRAESAYLRLRRAGEQGHRRVDRDGKAWKESGATCSMRDLSEPRQSEGRYPSCEKTQLRDPDSDQIDQYQPTSAEEGNRTEQIIVGLTPVETSKARRHPLPRESSVRCVVSTRSPRCTGKLILNRPAISK